MNSSAIGQSQRQMLAWIDALPRQLMDSAGFAGLDAVSRLKEQPAQILCCGMGGSSMAAGLLADGWPGLGVPLLTWREHGLPSWADHRTLVIACSHSGETAETLSATREARRRGCAVAAISSGGRLGAMANSDMDADSFPMVCIPCGQPPRTMLGASLGALLHLLHRFGLMPDPAPSIAGACAYLQRGELARMPDGRQATAQEAQKLATMLAGRFTVIFTAGLAVHGAGRRWLSQLNENAKTTGHHACYPELAHNEIVGWNLSVEERKRFALVILRDERLAEIETRSVDISIELLSDQFKEVRQYTACGPDHLSRVLGLILFGDLVSAYLAVETGVDPVPIARIDELKSQLARYKIRE